MADKENENVQLLIVAEKKEFKAVRGVHMGWDTRERKCIKQKEGKS